MGSCMIEYLTANWQTIRLIINNVNEIHNKKTGIGGIRGLG